MKVLVATKGDVMTNTEKANALHRELVGAVEQITSGEEWAAMLEVAARFHRYSFRNTILIRLQRPDATRVAGFNRWKDLGRHVRKGEKGIQILAPCTYRRKSEAPGSIGADSEETGDAAQEVRVLRGFRVAHVFDVAQTDGDPIPDVAPELLTGDEPEGLLTQLVEQITARGFTFALVPPADMPIRGANGCTDHLAHQVLVRDDVEPAQRAKTAAHELAHVLLHEPGMACRDRIEVEAESTAYVVLRAIGADPGSYSFPYVTRWAGGDTSLIASTGERVVGAARSILDAFADEEVAA